MRGEMLRNLRSPARLEVDRRAYPGVASGVIFLTSVGSIAGRLSVGTVTDIGTALLLSGAIVFSMTTTIILFVGPGLLMSPYDDLVGVASGAIKNSAILV